MNYKYKFLKYKSKLSNLQESVDNQNNLKESKEPNSQKPIELNSLELSSKEISELTCFYGRRCFNDHQVVKIIQPDSVYNNYYGKIFFTIYHRGSPSRSQNKLIKLSGQELATIDLEDRYKIPVFYEVKILILSPYNKNDTTIESEFFYELNLEMLFKFKF